MEGCGQCGTGELGDLVQGLMEGEDANSLTLCYRLHDHLLVFPRCDAGDHEPPGVSPPRGSVLYALSSAIRSAKTHSALLMRVSPSTLVPPRNRRRCPCSFRPWTPPRIRFSCVTFIVRQRSRGRSACPSSQRRGANNARGWTSKALSRSSNAASASTSCSGGLSWRRCHCSTWARALGASSIMR